MPNVPARLGTAATHLRLVGASWSDIAETLGLSGPEEALSLVTRELARNVTEADRDVLREEESQRLLKVLEPVMHRALDTSDPEHLAAVRTAVAVIDRRIRLMGLDAPTQIAIHTPTARELEAWVTRMAAIEVPAIEEADVVGL